MKLKLSASFLLISTGILSTIIIFSAIFSIKQMKKQMLSANYREAGLLREALDKKGNLLGSFLAKISFQAVVTDDQFALNGFATELFTDPEAVYVSIRNVADKDVFTKKSDSTVDTASLIKFKMPVAFGEGAPLAFLTLGLSEKILQTKISEMETQTKKQVRQLIYFCAGFALLLNILIAGSLVLVLKSIVIRPLGQVSRQLEDIAQGEGDLRKRIGMTSGNEVGIMARLFDSVLAKLQGIISLVAKQTTTLTSASSLLSENSSRMVSDSEKMSESATQVSASAGEATTKMREVSGSVEKIFQNVDIITNSLTQVNASMNEVSENCQKESQIASLANDKAQQAQKLVSRLEKAGEEIGKVLGVISGIANRTNLLALNATIEATRAGEFGLGFAVVAKEVKELSKQTTEATNEIGKTIQLIRDNTSESVMAIQEIAGIIEQVNSIASIIAAAVHEQSSTVNEVSINLNSVNQSSHIMNENLRSTSNWIEEVSGSFISVSNLAKNTSIGAKTIQESIQQLDNLAGELGQAVSGFKY